ncbi:hypothetical protein [Chryseolinea serpens]|nr:hypothetical protein [Chryseolinea serpens]
MTRKKLSTPTQAFIAVVAALMLTLATIGFQPIKAAMPVRRQV